MHKRSINNYSAFLMVPPETRGGSAVRSVQRVLDLIDTTDPSWPDVAALLREFTEAGICLDEASVAIAVKLGKQRWMAESPEGRGGEVQVTLACMSDSIVYYIRRGDLIKIGTTTDPYGRFRDLLPDEILAFEPGERPQEKQRHFRFRHLQAGGEYFRDDPELRDHIERVRSMYGAPDPDWPTTTTLGQRNASRPKKMWRLPSPTSTDTMTADQAAAELGIPDGTLRTWVHRGRLKPVGCDDRRRHFYYREHLIALRDSARTREVQRL
jgi:hypothetical protein